MTNHDAPCGACGHPVGWHRKANAPMRGYVTPGGCLECSCGRNDHQAAQQNRPILAHPAPDRIWIDPWGIDGPTYYSIRLDDHNVEYVRADSIGSGGHPHPTEKEAGQRHEPATEPAAPEPGDQGQGGEQAGVAAPESSEAQSQGPDDAPREPATPELRPKVQRMATYFGASHQRRHATMVVKTDLSYVADAFSALAVKLAALAETFDNGSTAARMTAEAMRESKANPTKPADGDGGAE